FSSEADAALATATALPSELPVAVIRISGLPGIGVAVISLPRALPWTDLTTPCRTRLALIIRLYTAASDWLACTTEPTASGTATLSWPTASCDVALYVGVRA